MTSEFSKQLAGVFLQNLDNEIPTTAKVIAAVPDTHHDYRPDPKSKTALELAGHIAATDIWFFEAIAESNFQIAPPAMPESAKTGADIAAWYSEAVEASKQKVAALSGEQLTVPVDFFGVMNLPAVLYLQLLNNHMVHHRGQLSTYLRAMGGKCPSIYGGSADEPFNG